MIHKGRDSPTLYCSSHQEERFQLPLETTGRWWVRSGSVQVTSGAVLGGDAPLESCEDCLKPSHWAALGTARPFLALHSPVAGMTCCGTGSQTSLQWCSTLSRPRANSLLKWLSYFSSSQGNVLAHRQRKKALESTAAVPCLQLTVDLSSIMC